MLGTCKVEIERMVGSSIAKVSQLTVLMKKLLAKAAIANARPGRVGVS